LVAARWDVFHADRLEVQRGLTTEQVRAALASGELREDDLIRPAATTTPWARLVEIPELIAPAPPPPSAPSPGRDQAFPEANASRPLPATETPQPTPDPSSDISFPVLREGPLQPEASGPQPGPDHRAWPWDELDDEEELEILADEDSPSANPLAPANPPEPALPWSHDREEFEGPAPGRFEQAPRSRVALPVVPSRDRDIETAPDGADEDEEAPWSLARSPTRKVEELDLAPMVDVAFQLVLFFMVTATTVLYKTLEIPKPSGESPAPAVAQGRSRSLDDLRADYVLVEIDAEGNMKLDREPIEPEMGALVERLRRAREQTGRKAMLLAADYATLHRNAVLAYDAANEIGMGIAIARPSRPQGPAPTLRPAGVPLQAGINPPGAPGSNQVPRSPGP
jgi:biopolymer transport protein ExbD